MFKWSSRLLLAVVLVLGLMAGQGICAKAVKVAVLPFAMNSPQDLGFLQNGLYSMLTSRLADPGRVNVLEREVVEKELAGKAASLTEAKARELGGRLAVDFVLFGSLTHFGESVSLDAKIVDVHGKKPTLSFFEQSNNMGDVIPLVNSFAGDINMKMFNRNISNDLYVKPQEQQRAPGDLEFSGSGGLVNLQQATGKGFATYSKFKGVIAAMAAGDLNKDGVLQVVTATDSALYFSELENNHLVEKQKIEFSRTTRIAALDVADINKNGYPEIFVTSINLHHEGLNSFVVEFDGKNYVTISDDLPYYFRVIKDMDGIDVLLGQKVGRNPFQGDIYRMAVSGDGYSRAKRLRLPRSTSVLSLNQGIVTQEGRPDYVLINESGRLVVASDTGNVEWKGNRKFGGTEHYFYLPSQDPDASYRERMYLNSRITFYDADDDGKQEIVTVRNEELGGGALGRYKRFQKGQIEIMTWNGIGITPVFSTRANQGWISDFFIADIDADGENELVVSVVGKAKILLGTGDRTSNIIAYELN
ncbi:MAG: CsgG/HfaB family protein [Desulfobacterales bacterium]|nr:CsgG/HfaB family protein [Desulfobacterales bacterium]